MPLYGPIGSPTTKLITFSLALIMFFEETLGGFTSTALFE